MTAPSARSKPAVVGLFRSRLAVRIYLVGLAQFFLVAVGLVVVARERRPSLPSLESLRFVADSVASVADDPEAVATTLASAEKIVGTRLAVFDDAHRWVAGTVLPPAHRMGNDHPPFPPDHPPPPPPFGPPPDGRGRHPPPLPRHDEYDVGGLFGDAAPPFDGPEGVPIKLRDGRVWRLVASAPPPPPSFVRAMGTTVVLVLFIVSISAWVTARSLAKPLARLSEATRAFGAGDVTARARLGRKDELGDVATAFDQMADRVTAALRAEKELLANISHELRTPLQRIHIAMDLAAEGDAETARESLGEVAQDLAELERIVDDVLAAARLSLQGGDGSASPLPPIHVADVDVAVLLTRSETRFRILHPTRELRIDVPNNLPFLRVDAALVRRAVDNLLDNAHKYTEDPKEPVSLSAFLSKGQLVVLVRDHGVGIDAADLERLFEPFFRADRSRTRASGGLGLGLTLAKRIILAHGGTLSLTSAAEEGTTARIELPVTPVSASQSHMNG